MSHYQLPQDTSFNFSSGIDQLFLYVADQVPIFFPAVLFAFFMVITLGGFFLEQKTSGRGDFLKWMAVSSFLTSGLSYILSIQDGFISTSVLILVFVVTALLNTLYFLNNR